MISFLISFLVFLKGFGESALDHLCVPVGPCFGCFWIHSAVGGRSGLQFLGVVLALLKLLGNLEAFKKGTCDVTQNWKRSPLFGLSRNEFLLTSVTYDSKVLGANVHNAMYIDVQY